MREPEDGWLEREGIRLHFLEWRPESERLLEPPILLLHGLSSNSWYWERVARHLPDRRLVALDQRGHGLTGKAPPQPRLPDGYAMSELTQDVAFVSSQLRLDRPVVVGHSWGATVALEVVGTHPGLASGLVFIDGPVQSASNLFSWEEAQRIMQPPLPRFADRTAAVAASRADFGTAWGDDLETFVDIRVMPDADELILTLSAPVRFELLKGLYESQPDLLWPLIEVPAAALLATQNIARTSRFKGAGAVRLAEIAPQVEVRWFDAPHDIPLYLPEEIAAEISGVAARAEAAIGSEPPSR